MLALWLGWVHSTVAAETWATGPALQEQLSQQIDVLWSGKPLRQALMDVSRRQKVAILLDRRVDPDQKVELSGHDMAIEAILESLARQHGLGTCQLDSLVYVGPPETAARLPGLAALRKEDVQRLPLAAARRFRQQEGMAWDDLAEPRLLLAELARQNGLTIEGLERVPHDLWPALDLPPMSLVDRLTLIAVQFDLTFQLAADGQDLTLTSIPDDLEEQQRTTPSRSPAQEPSRRLVNEPARRSSRNAPQPAASKSAADPNRIRIERFSVQNEPLGAVLRQLAERLKLELRIDRQAVTDAGISLDQRVSVTVGNVTIDELLRELLRSTGLRFRRLQNVVEIRPEK